VIDFSKHIILSTMTTFLLSLSISTCATGESVSGPLVVCTSPPNKCIVQLPDGTIKSFFTVEGKNCASSISTDGGRTWSKPKIEFESTVPEAGVVVALVDKDGQLHAFMLARRDTGHRPMVDYFIDIWHCKTIAGLTEWSEPKCIYEGYVGALNGVVQLKSGRIVLPQQCWLAGVPCAPPTGCHIVTTNYSDDGGETWKLSEAKLTAPCHTDYLSETYGACEPVIIELKDGRAWMLMRTQTGYLYESFSRDGVNWSEAKASRFYSSDSPANLLRLPDGRIVVFWNNCKDSTRVNGAAVYTNRDALHAAISDDEGQSWRGYREISRDPNRNEPPPQQGDRGTAYPFSAATSDGKILLATGQGRGREVFMLIDPDWLCETHHEDDFSNGLDGWSIFKPFGPITGRVWRNRTIGAVLADHPTKAGAKVLHVRRPDEKDGDCAIWNFPSGSKGKLTMNIMLREGFGGASIALADCFITPNDPAADKLVPFKLSIDNDGKLPGGAKLQKGQWYSVDLVWDMKKDQCEVLIDSKKVVILTQLNKDSHDISYLRLESKAKTTDPAGFLLEYVKVNCGE